MLDKKMLEDMPSGTIFATGIRFDNRLYKDGEIRWIAKRGGVYDWAIYYHHSGLSIEVVSMTGDKCFTEEIIRDLVPCDDEAFALYRF